MNKPYEYVTDLFQKIREDISEIKHKLFIDKAKSESVDTPRQYAINAVQKHPQPDEEHSNVVRATLNLPESIHIETKTAEHKERWYKDRTVWLQIAAILVGSVVAVIYFFQWRTMIATVDTTRQASERDERAWVRAIEVGGPQVMPNQPLQWAIQIQNIGKTPARNIHGQFLIEIIQDGSGT